MITAGQAILIYLIRIVVAHRDVPSQPAGEASDPLLPGREAMEEKATVEA